MMTGNSTAACLKVRLTLPLRWHVACRKQLENMMSHMKEGLAGKIGNRNNNAFRLRKLFKMYDRQGTGQVGCSPPRKHLTRRCGL